MKERLLLILQEERMTSNKFAELMEIRPSNVSHLLAGRNNPNFEFIGKMLVRFPNLNPDWLINGVGNMKRDPYSDLFGFGAALNNHSEELVFDDVASSDNIEINEPTSVSAPIAAQEEIINVESLSIPFLEQKEILLGEKENQKEINIISTNQSSGELTENNKQPSNNVTSTQIEKMVVFYSDKTFEIYNHK